MLPTYEAILQPDWGLEFSDLEPPRFAQAQRVLVTVLPNQQPVAGAAPENLDWNNVRGLLKGSAIFGADPLLIQQEMRNEWR